MSNMLAARLGPEQRERTLDRLRSERFDVVVTGCGIALDAATRGLSVALIEQRDYAAGTSSRSGKLIHGGLRYMEHLRFGLVRESLNERALLLRRLCPHLVKPMRFLYLLEHTGWERAYLGAGLALYDTLGGAGAVPRHKHLSRRGTLRVAPALRADAFTGAVSFYDTQCDDARHTLTLARTAAAYGAQVATHTEAVGFERARGRVTAVNVHTPDDAFTIAARHVVTATGVWTNTMSMRASKGVHLVVPRERIDADAAFVLRAEREPQLFVRPWNDSRFWMFGTTDTPYDGDLADPQATAEDVDYLLRNVNNVLRTPLTDADVVGAFAGLRPLVDDASEQTSRASREHTVASPEPGLTAIAGGKYTTYRVMAADAVDAVVNDLGGPKSCTDRIPLLGAEGYPALWNQRHRIAQEAGLEPARVEHLLNRYGSLLGELLELVRERPELGRPIDGAEHYLRVEALYAVTHEGALSLEDVLERRTRIAIETRDRETAAECVADVLAHAEMGA